MEFDEIRKQIERETRMSLLLCCGMMSLVLALALLKDLPGASDVLLGESISGIK